MKGFLNFLNLKFLPLSPDFGLLLLRAGLGACMLWLHGWRKVEVTLAWGRYARDEAARKAEIAKFPDPLHIGRDWSIGVTGAVEVICSALLIIGFCSRFAAAGLVFVLSVAFFIAHQHLVSVGEMALVYLLGFTALLFAGPGRFAFDGGGGGGDKH